MRSTTERGQRKRLIRRYGRPGWLATACLVAGCPTMPALDLFGRRWALAADDIPLLAFPAAVFHGLWFIFLVVAFSAIQKPNACARSQSYEACSVGLFVCFFLSCIIESWLVREGLKGVPNSLSPKLSSMYLIISVTSLPNPTPNFCRRNI